MDAKNIRKSRASIENLEFRFVLLCNEELRILNAMKLQILSSILSELLTCAVHDSVV